VALVGDGTREVVLVVVEQEGIQPLAGVKAHVVRGRDVDRRLGVLGAARVIQAPRVRT